MQGQSLSLVGELKNLQWSKRNMYNFKAYLAEWGER